MSSGPGLTVAEYAARRGISDSYVRRLRREGRLVVIGKKRIDAEASDARLDAEGDALRGGDHSGAPDPAGARPEAHGAVPGGVATVREGQRQKLEQEIERLRRENLEGAKRTASRDVVERAIFTLARQALTRLRSLPARLRAQLAAETDPRAVEALLAGEIQQLCEDLQREAQQMRDSRFGVDQVAA